MLFKSGNKKVYYTENHQSTLKSNAIAMANKIRSRGARARVIKQGKIYLVYSRIGKNDTERRKLIRRNK